MHRLEMLTGFFKGMANKLWTVICTDNRAIITIELLPFPQSTLENLSSMFSFAGQSEMVVHDRSIIDINETHQEKETLFSYDKSVFYVHLPQLIRSGNLSVVCQLSRMFPFLLSLWLQEFFFFQQAVNLFLVDDQLVVSP